MTRHTPFGDPCQKCGEALYLHRPAHEPKGNPCALCHVPATNHRVKHAPRQGDRCDCGASLYNHFGYKKLFKQRQEYYVGIDGEGQGRAPHRYVLICASSEDGEKIWSEEDHRGLSTVDCLEFILRIPKEARLFAYSFNYDLTKILKDVDSETLYYLFRPDHRQRSNNEGKKGLLPVYWEDYELNLQGTKFTIKRGRTERVIWDIWKFFQGKFVSALKDWKLGNNLEFMARMKDQRGEFDRLDKEEVKAYCFEECRYMAALARRLTEAHNETGLKLKNYYGAGSSASAILDKMDIKKLRGESPVGMERAVAAAFFGGRFENSVLGNIPGPVYSYDISSAYPYQLCFLPCLVHARWRLTSSRKRMTRARHALVHFGMDKAPRRVRQLWAPFPFRDQDGAIIFPKTFGGGWLWRDEYLAGERLFKKWKGYIRFREAWVLESNCGCESPFSKIPHYYKERLRIGKEGAGIVLKLATNACYGKLAQSQGKKPPFQSWIWAGMITSGTRAQILEMMALHEDLNNLLMIATDGIYTKERLKTPEPKDTETFDAIDSSNGKKKPLGAWEEKIMTKGVFAARPGVYFPMNPTEEELKEVRGRGIGKSNMLRSWQLMVEAFQEGKESVVIALCRKCKINVKCDKPKDKKDKIRCPICNSQANGIERFIGAKSAIHTRGEEGKESFEVVRSTEYGEWIERMIEISFNPLPKRDGVNKDGLTLKLRSFPGKESIPYEKARMSPEAVELREQEEEANEQPDGGDWVEYV